MKEAKFVDGQARVCSACNIRTATHEQCVEVDGKIYHIHHNPLTTVMYCKVGRTFDAAKIWTINAKQQVSQRQQ